MNSSDLPVVNVELTQKNALIQSQLPDIISHVKEMEKQAFELNEQLGTLHLSTAAIRLPEGASAHPASSHQEDEPRRLAQEVREQTLLLAKLQFCKTIVNQIEEQLLWILDQLETQHLIDD